MSFNFLLDMNVSAEWIPMLTVAGHTAIRWSQLGPVDAEDTEVMTRARTNSSIVFTNDLDFSQLLAFTNATSPSVVLLRDQDVLPNDRSGQVVQAIRQAETELESGALLVIETHRSRIRILPLRG